MSILGRIKSSIIIKQSQPYMHKKSNHYFWLCCMLNSYAWICTKFCVILAHISSLYFRCRIYSNVMRNKHVYLARKLYESLSCYSSSSTIYKWQCCFWQLDALPHANPLPLSRHGTSNALALVEFLLAIQISTIYFHIFFIYNRDFSNISDSPPCVS